MRLALKFTLAFLAGMCIVLAVHAWLTLRREVVLFESDQRRDERVLGHALALATRDVWEAFGEAAALAFVDRIDQSEHQHGVGVRWLGLDAPPDSPYAPKLGDEALAELRQGREVAWTDVTDEGTQVLRTIVPVRALGPVPGALEVSETLTEQRRYVRSTLLRILAATAAVAGVSSGLTLLLGWRFVGRPVRSLIESARAVAAGDFTARLHFHQNDELRELAEELNRMCDRLQEAHDHLAHETAAKIATIEQLRHADRLATVGQLAAGVAHELGTPLNVVWARARMVTNADAGLPEISDNGRIIAEQAERMTRIIRQLLDFARPRPPRRVSTDLVGIVCQTFGLLKSMAEKRRVALELDSTEDRVTARVDPDQLQQVLSNLIMNAVQAMPDGGVVTVGLDLTRVRPPADHGGPEADYVRVQVRDEGTGIAKENLAHVFEPFFTTKDVGEGTGLGLSVSRGIIHEHGGWLDVSSEEGRGSCFAIYLPKEVDP